MKKLLLLLFSVSILFSACNRNTDDNPDPTSPPTMEDLNVSDSFNWKTTKDYKLELTGNTDNMIEVASDKGIAYQKAYLKANVAYTMNLTLPSYEKSVILKYMGQEVTIELSSENLSYEFQ